MIRVRDQAGLFRVRAGARVRVRVLIYRINGEIQVLQRHGERRVRVRVRVRVSLIYGMNGESQELQRQIEGFGLRLGCKIYLSLPIRSTVTS